MYLLLYIAQGYSTNYSAVIKTETYSERRQIFKMKRFLAQGQGVWGICGTRAT